MIDFVVRRRPTCSFFKILGGRSGFTKHSWKCTVAGFSGVFIPEFGRLLFVWSSMMLTIYTVDQHSQI
jgi:hypothetical protein